MFTDNHNKFGEFDQEIVIVKGVPGKDFPEVVNTLD